VGPQPVVLFGPVALRDNRLMDPSLGPWTFSEHMYGIAHCLIDRDGRVIGAQILRELVAGVPAEQLRRRAAQVIKRIDTVRPREPGEDDE
jgi:hypothetical protein